MSRENININRSTSVETIIINVEKEINQNNKCSWKEGNFVEGFWGSFNSVPLFPSSVGHAVLFLMFIISCCMEDLDLPNSLNLADKWRGNSKIHREGNTVLTLKTLLHMRIMLPIMKTYFNECMQLIST